MRVAELTMARALDENEDLRRRLEAVANLLGMPWDGDLVGEVKRRKDRLAEVRRQAHALTRRDPRPGGPDLNRRSIALYEAQASGAAHPDDGAVDNTDAKEAE